MISPSRIRSTQFLFSGYTFDQEQRFKQRREQIRAELETEFNAMMSGTDIGTTSKNVI